MSPAALKRLCLRILQLMLVLSLATYLSFYVILSRKAFAYSKQIGIDGFWFVVPLSNEARHQNDLCNKMFWPAVQIVWAIGIGMKPLCNPMIEMTGPKQREERDDQTDDEIIGARAK